MRAIKYTLPQKIETWIETELNRLGTSLQQPKVLAHSIKKMADYYIEHPSGATPWNEKWCQQAQLAYYFPLNLIRNFRVFEELEKVNFFEEKLHWHEFGVGLGPSLEAFLSSPINNKKLIGCTLSERGSFPRDSFQRRMNHNPILSTIQWPDKLPRVLPAKSLVIMSYSLTELQSLPDWLWEAEAIIIIEPSTRDDGRRLMSLREEAHKKNYRTLAPCTHQDLCPLLHQSKKDWCHDRVFFNRPQWLIEIEDHLPFSNSTLTLSYLALKKTTNLKRDILSSNQVRVVGDFLDEKGKSRQLICRGPQREFLTFIKKSDNPIELYRGEIITLDEPILKKGEELRLSPDQVHVK